MFALQIPSTMIDKALEVIAKSVLFSPTLLFQFLLDFFCFLKCQIFSQSLISAFKEWVSGFLFNECFFQTILNLILGMTI